MRFIELVQFHDPQISRNIIVDNTEKRGISNLFDEKAQFAFAMENRFNQSTVDMPVQIGRIELV